MKNNSGQVLIMVLIVMMILAIIIITMAHLSVQDIQQAEYNVDYETLYTTAEKHIVDISHTLPMKEGTKTSIDEVVGAINKNGFNLSATNSDDCTKHDPTTTEDRGKTVIVCRIKENSQDDTNNIQLKITENPSLENIEIQKDDVVGFRILKEDGRLYGSGDPGNFQVSWTTNNTSANVAIEVSLDFKHKDLNDNVRYSTVRGVYDANVPKMFNNISNDYFKFTPNASNTKAFSFSYSELINTIKQNLLNKNSTNKDISHYSKGFSDLDSIEITPIEFRYKAYITSGSEEKPSIFLNVFAENTDSNFPQSRQYEATVYNLRELENTKTSVFGTRPFVISSVPYYRHIPIFDYVLRSGTPIGE